MNRPGAQLRAGVEDLMALGQFQRVIDICKQTLAAAREEQDGTTEAMSLVGLAQAHRALGKYKEALILTDGAIEYGYRFGVLEAVCEGLLERAWIKHGVQLQPYEAREDYREALTVANEIGYQSGVGAALNGLAAVELNLQNLRNVHNYAREALDTASEIDDVILQVRALLTLGRHFATANHIDLALRSLTDALARASDKQYAALQGQVLEAVGRLYLTQKQPTKALNYLGRAHEIGRKSGAVDLEVACLLGLGETYMQQEDYAEARKCFDAVVQISDETDNTMYEAAAAMQIALLHLYMREPSIAIDYQRRAAQISHNAMNPFMESRALQHLALTQRAVGEHTAAIAALNEALDIERSLDNDKAVREILASLVWTHILNAFNKLLRLLNLSRDEDE